MADENEETIADHMLIEQGLRRVSHIRSSYKAAKVLGVSDSTIRRWREKQAASEPFGPLQQDTRDALRSGTVLDAVLRRLEGPGPGIRRRIDAARQEVLEEAYDPDSPAEEQLLVFLVLRAGFGAVAAELVDKDLVGAAYALGRKVQLPPDDFLALDEWRKEIERRYARLANGARRPADSDAADSAAEEAREIGGGSEADQTG